MNKVLSLKIDHNVWGFLVRRGDIFQCWGKLTSLCYHSTYQNESKIY